MRQELSLNLMDTHAGGDVSRIVLGGIDPLPGKTVRQHMEYLRDDADGLRRLLLEEPYGIPEMSVDLIVPPSHPDASVGYIIGHGNIGGDVPRAHPRLQGYGPQEPGPVHPCHRQRLGQAEGRAVQGCTRPHACVRRAHDRRDHGRAGGGVEATRAAVAAAMVASEWAAPRSVCSGGMQPAQWP